MTVQPEKKLPLITATGKKSLLHGCMRGCSTHPLLSIFFLALVARLVYLGEQIAHPEYLLPVIDGATYHRFATRWVMEGVRDPTTAWYAPFYPVFLSALYAVTGPSVVVAKIFQSVLGAVSAMLVTRAAGLWAGSRAAWLAGSFIALNGPVIFYELELMPAGWSVFWSALALNNLPSPTSRRLFPDPVLHGFLAAGASLIRPELFVGYLAAVLARHILMHHGHPYPWRRMGVSTVFACAVYFLCVVPFGLLNREFTGRLSWFPSNSALNFYIGNSPDLCATLGARPGPDYERIVQEPVRIGLLSAEARSRYYYGKVREFVLNQPGKAAENILCKLGMLLCGREVTADVDVYAARESSQLLSLVAWKAGRFGFPFGILLPFAIAGFYCERNRRAACLIVFLIVTGCVMILWHPAARYRLILIPPIVIFAAIGMVRVLDGNRRVTTIMLMLIAAIGAIPVSCLEKTDYVAERYRLIGQVLLPVNPDGVLWVHRALQRVPEDPQAFFLLGLNAYENGKSKEAALLLDQALQWTPDYLIALVLRGEIAEKEGAIESAQSFYQQALVADPLNAMALEKSHKLGEKRGKTQ